MATTSKTIMVTGGAGFVGSAVCRLLASRPNVNVLNVDKLTYAGNLNSLKSIENNQNYLHAKVDVCDAKSIAKLLADHAVDAIMHLAAESHVDRSIDGPEAFVQTNVVGTFQLLQATLEYWRDLPGVRQRSFRFHHVSTDEVFGDLPFDSGVFTEESAYAPSSPYSASKAASDHFVRAWHETYGLPVILSNCSNNYGPYQFPEKLIPLAVLNALEGKAMPIYGNGENVRDWLHVEDHARALETLIMHGKVGESYNIGGRAERTNLQVVQAICGFLDQKCRKFSGASYLEQIAFVDDRPGHDRRYAIDCSKVERDLGWEAKQTFESGLSSTIDWYLQNDWWWKSIRNDDYECKRLDVAQDLEIMP